VTRAAAMRPRDRQNARYVWHNLSVPFDEDIRIDKLLKDFKDGARLHSVTFGNPS
jgi:hypothetical protein